MKVTFYYIFFIATLFLSCTQKKTPPAVLYDDPSKIFSLDSSLRDSIKPLIKFTSGRGISSFKTPIEIRFFTNKTLLDSIVKPEFSMMSWYSINNDTIDLVAHFGFFESYALLLRFYGGQPSVFFFRASHSGQKFFRLNRSDSFNYQLEVPPVKYRLQLSQIPDTLNKQIIYGHIDMESEDYYDIRDTLEQTQRIKMKFFFGSQFRRFDFSD